MQSQADTIEASPTSKLHSLLQFVKNHPKAVWLKADLLRIAGTGLDDYSDETVFSGLGQNSSQNRDRTSAEKWLPSLQVARDGARQDPGNAFFPIMEALFEFQSNQNAKALQTVNSLPSHPRYDDYTQEEMTRRTALVYRIHPLSWEKRWAIMVGTHFDYLWSVEAMAHGFQVAAQHAGMVGNTRLALEQTKRR